MSFTNLPLMKQIHARVNKTLSNGIQLNMSTEESKKLLRRHVNSKTNLVIVFIDINNSTQMSLSLPENKFALMIQTFTLRVFKNPLQVEFLFSAGNVEIFFTTVF